MEKKNLSANHIKTESYEVPLPPPPLDPSYETLLKHKNDKIIWNDFDYIVNYDPIIKNNNPYWKKCKLLGSLLGTKQDMERRKIIVIDSMKTLSHIFKSKHISFKLKVRTFTALINSVMLYNSELWTVTKQMEEKINALQRRHLRIILNRT